jgi:hypothetical protein
MANKERVRLLVDALRSGEFPQCTGRLGRIDKSGKKGYCCLGVAIIIAARNGCDVLVEWIDDELMVERAETDLLVSKVSEWYGFNSINPVISYDNEEISEEYENSSFEAAELNDSGIPFEEIANRFESVYINDR